MGQIVVMSSRQSGKSQLRKDAWIAETQMFQRIAHGRDGADSYEKLAAYFEQHLSENARRRARHNNRRAE